MSRPRAATTSTSPAAATCTSSPTAAIGQSGDIVKAIACGADAVMLGSPLARATDAPGGGFHWGAEAHHPELPRGQRVRGRHRSRRSRRSSSARRTVADGTMNLVGALRRSMATTGYSDLKEFQRVEVVVAPYQRAERSTARELGAVASAHLGT